MIIVMFICSSTVIIFRRVGHQVPLLCVGVTISVIHTYYKIMCMQQMVKTLSIKVKHTLMDPFLNHLLADFLTTHLHLEPMFEAFLAGPLSPSTYMREEILAPDI